MSEFVEDHLEQLISVFELLQTVGLFSSTEVKEFVKRCRNYEYRLQKTCKDPKDFLVYADYLYDALKLIRLRRKKLNYMFKYNEIDGAMKAKIADVYKTVSLRFQGKKELWRKRLNFLKKEKMRNRCSKTFFRAIQVLGNDINLREEAALWEFNHNKSIDNARLHLQLGLRFAPEAVLLWICFLKIEIMNVERLLERKKVLTGEMKKQNDDGASSSVELGEDESVAVSDINDSDPVLNFRLAEVIINQALQTPEITDKNKLLLEMWRCVFQFKEIAKRLEQELYDKFWLPGNECEESWIARYERIPNQDPYDLLDKSCDQFMTEKMLRYYIKICYDRVMLDGKFYNVYATVKLKELLYRLHDKNYAQIEDYKKLLRYDEDHKEKIQLLEAALKRFPSSSLLWIELIRLKTNQETEMKEIERLFNEAETKVNPDESLPIYQLAIDWAIAKAPSKVDKVFKRAMLVGSRSVSSSIKCIRLRYCKAAYPKDPSIFRDEYKKLCSSLPNDKIFYETYIRLEKEMNEPKSQLILAAFENYVSELGSNQYECWIDYAEYLLSVKPAAISTLYQRALACIPKEDCDLFSKAWALMIRESHLHKLEEAEKDGKLHLGDSDDRVFGKEKEYQKEIAID